MIFLYIIIGYFIIAGIVGLKEDDAMTGLLWPLLLLLWILHIAGFRIH